MKKICLVVVGFYLGILAAFSQQADSATYKSRKLKLEEVNLVSSYYSQNGNNSAVEGGVGSEKLNDIANVIDIKLSVYDKRKRKHTFTGEVGIDHYTSASSDRIDTKANSSASSADTRIYPSLSWSLENEKKGTSLGLNISASTEFDYKSFGFGANFSIKSKDKNRELGIKAQAYLDKVSLIYPVELRTASNTGNGGEHENYQTSSRNSFSGSLSLAQVINKRLQVMFIADLVKQEGFLSLPFHRVYFKEDLNNAKIEKLPSSRLKIPLGFRASYFLGDKIILRSFYRFYHDDWGLNANTIDLETSFKVTPFFSIAPFYRYYHQTGVDYFAAINEHKTSEEFYTSNYDLSKFNSNFFGGGLRYAPPKGVLGIKNWGMVELRYGHYNRSTGLNSDIITLNLKLK
ncbi:MAG: DUF3570 domain-containing protein [Ferruginibacter sp.]